MKSWLTRGALTEAPAAPSEGARASAGTPAPSAPRPRGRWWLMGAAGAAIAVLLIVGLARREGVATTALAEGPRVAAVERRDFVRSVRIHGVVEAVESFTVSAPRLAGPGLNTLVITRLAAAGSRVERGDLLAEFDRESQMQIALDRRAEYLDLEEQIKKKQAEHDAARARDETELEQATNALAAAELDMRRNEILSRIDAEKNQQNLEEARARLAQLRETLELKRTARRAELRVLEIQRDRARNAMRHAEANAEKMSIRAPFPGLVVLNSIWKGGQMAEVLEGDEVRPGVPFLQVVNPEVMQVRARVNQADFAALRPDMTVEVRLDAYPELSFPGRVRTLAAVGSVSGMNERVRYFPTVFSITGSHPQLLPDLSASVDVEIERAAGALVAPRDAVFHEDGRAYVQVQRGSSFEKRAVELGPASDAEVVITSGIEAGAAVLRVPKLREGGRR